MGIKGYDCLVLDYLQSVRQLLSHLDFEMGIDTPADNINKE